jgi:hypothetical protein
MIRHFPDDGSLTTAVSDVYDSTGLGRFDQRIPGVPSLWQAGLIRTEPLRFKFLMLTGGARKGMPP